MDGLVSLQEYMAFMISRETENIQSISDIIQAFKALTHAGEKPYIMSSEIYAVSWSCCVRTKAVCDRSVSSWDREWQYQRHVVWTLRILPTIHQKKSGCFWCPKIQSCNGSNLFYSKLVNFRSQHFLTIYFYYHLFIAAVDINVYNAVWPRQTNQSNQ